MKSESLGVGISKNGMVIIQNGNIEMNYSPPFVVRAVKSHKDLLKAAKYAQGLCSYPGCNTCQEIEKTINKAEGK